MTVGIRRKVSASSAISPETISFWRNVVNNISTELEQEKVAPVLQQGIRFIDFFSGAGGMSCGFHTMGEHTGIYKGAGAFDIDPYANKSYERNFGIQPSNLDLGNASIDEIRAALDPSVMSGEGPLVVIGCAPCQGFSAHKKKDPRKDGRNTLVGRFAEIAVALDADVIVMENVPDLLGSKHWHHYEAFRSTVEAAKYRVTAQVVNMAEYGVPQERFRAVVIAARNFIPTFPPKIRERGTFRTVRDVIGHLPPLATGGVCDDDLMHVTSKHRRETVEILRQIPKDGGSRPSGVGPSCLDNVAGFYDVYGRLAWDKPAVTITARCRTPSCGRFAHPEQNRGMSVREAALLQSFPENFHFEGPFDDKFKQIGNAVPPLFSLQLAAHLARLLSGQHHGKIEEWVSITKPEFNSFSGRIAQIKRGRGK